jgi:hypothetical protein
MDEALRRETETLIRAIWGPSACQLPDAASIPIDPAAREQQNKALASAIRAYLQQYLDELTPVA